MSSFRHAHLHIYPLPSTPHVRKGAAKTPRSASSTPRITNKATKVTKHPKEEDLEDLEDQDDDGMASSFLQFWYISKFQTSFLPRSNPTRSGHCEKQIVVPNASILYCSEKWETSSTS